MLIFVETFNNMDYFEFIDLEPYLAQWFAHENGNTYPIEIKRGSAESDLLQFFLQPQPRDPEYRVQIKALPGQVKIKIPWFKYKDIRTYNYLSPAGRSAIHGCIRNRFKVKLWKDLHTVGNVIQRNDIAITTWMEAHGIEVDDTNWNTIAKILQRCRASYCKDNRLTSHKTSKHKKKQ